MCLEQREALYMCLIYHFKNWCVSVCVSVCVCVCVCVCACSVVSDSLRPHGLRACLAPLSLGFPRQEHRSAFPFPSSGNLIDPGIEPRSALQAVSCLAGGFFNN